MIRAIRGASAWTPQRRGASPASVSPERFAALEAERSRLVVELEEAQRRASAAEAAVAVAAGVESQARVAALALAVHRELLEVQALRHAGFSPVLPPEAGSPLAAATAGKAPKRRGIRRFLYVDTVLPMLAVVIVLVILLAWLD